jgi:shufflon protein
MRLSTRTKATFAVATLASLIGAVAWAQNIEVKGNAWFATGGSGNVGIGTATPNAKLHVVGPITMTSPDSTNIYGLTLQRTNENSRLHEWKWWHMNSLYGQDSLQLYEYQTDSAGINCNGNAADGAMCAPRFIVNKGGNVGIGLSSAAYRLDVAGDVHSTGWLRTDGQTGWYSQTYGGGWYMSDTTWIRAYGDKGVWTGTGLLGSDGGLTVGYGGSGPAALGSAIIKGNVGIGTSSPAVKLAVNGSGTNVYATDAWVENNMHVQGNENLVQGGRGRLRVGTAWNYVGMYAEASSTGAANDLVLGASSGLVRIPQSLAVAGTISVADGIPVYVMNTMCANAGLLTRVSTCNQTAYPYYSHNNTYAGKLVQ